MIFFCCFVTGNVCGPVSVYLSFERHLVFVRCLLSFLAPDCLVSNPPQKCATVLCLTPLKSVRISISFSSFLGYPGEESHF